MPWLIKTEEEDRTVIGNKRYVSGSITLVDNYTENGEPLTAKQLGFDTLRSLSVFHGIANSSYTPVYDKTNNVIKVVDGQSVEHFSGVVAVNEQLTFLFDAIGW